MVKAAVLDRLWTRMSERGDFPMLSQSLRTTMAAMNNDELDFSALVRVVLSDFALTQKVLRLANSAMYMAFGGNITNVFLAACTLSLRAWLQRHDTVPEDPLVMRMPLGPSSTASICTIASWPALETAYAVPPELEKYRVPLMLEVTTIAPPPAFFRCGTVA